VWIFIWALVSIFILGVFGWSVQILLLQKAAWKTYARKMKLNYQEGRGILSSPILSGSLGPYGFALFSEEIQTADARGRRFNTVIEIALRQSMPMTGVIGTESMAPAINALAIQQTMSPADPDWNNAWLIRTDNMKAMEQFLTKDRIETLKRLFRMKILAALFIFDQTDSVLRLETADPLSDAARLEKIVKSLIQQAEILTLQPGERAALTAIRAQPESDIIAPPAPEKENPPEA
jgi:hypothetical protein